jgi:hypothetical protein
MAARAYGIRIGDVRDRGSNLASSSRESLPRSGGRGDFVDVVGPRDEGDVEHDLDHLGIVIAGGMAMTGPVTARIISGTTSNVWAQGPPRVALCWTGVPVF